MITEDRYMSCVVTGQTCIDQRPIQVKVVTVETCIGQGGNSRDMHMTQ